MQKTIIKEDGEREVFRQEKIKKSLLRAGAEPKTADHVIGVIQEHLEKISESKHIYKLALKHLRKKQPEAAIKYTLKKALMNMGPAGYVFEKYVAKILKEYGYRTEVGKMVHGACVEHEIDVIAHQGDSHYMIECKYHNNKGAKSSIQTALYVYARFLDIKKANKDRRQDYQFKEVWLATNTACSSMVKKYASCVKMGVIAWHHPQEKNLEYYIENKKLYPISILPGLKTKQRDQLFEKDIVTVKDLLAHSPQAIASLLSIKKSAADRLLAKAAMTIV